MLKCTQLHVKYEKLQKHMWNVHTTYGILGYLKTYSCIKKTQVRKQSTVAPEVALLPTQQVSDLE